MADSGHWSDFVQTPPNYSTSPSYGPFSEFNESWLQPQTFQVLLNEENYPNNNASVESPLQVPVQGQQQFQSYVPYNDYNEIENRTITITNINPHVTQAEIEEAFTTSSSVKSIDTSKLDSGVVTIEYYDLRDAMKAKKMKNGTTLHGNAIMVSYAPLPKIDDPKKPPNNGTIVVFHLPSGINDQHIESSFGQFGEIRQIRGTPAKPNQRFIEYYDTRAAEAALNGLSGKFVMGSRVSIEFSLPGGFRRNAQKQDPTVIRTHR
ncbi:protein MEI2-like 3 isoform X2 [Histomonas meleagridis]|uniref:protein MEI2-like 3 isoform X2 n=1 Tax=Histomonas meleagridis TaxID=135588 RepID=UPI0035593C7F|nr:protein MEI2-like 3 isoform X2 [Histomonas meleagridis]KAH0805518.1 protein MEI2-like 3 isoform X2 [Histomonas meleagridis]